MQLWTRFELRFWTEGFTCFGIGLIALFFRLFLFVNEFDFFYGSGLRLIDRKIERKRFSQLMAAKFMVLYGRSQWLPWSHSRKKSPER